MKRNYILMSILLSFFSFLLLSSVFLNSVRSRQQFNFLNDSNSAYILFYKGECASSLNNDFYCLNSKYSISTNGHKIKADILMLKDTSNYTLNFDTFDITENGICISKNIAQERELKVGDKLLLSSAFSEDESKYTVQKIISCCYGVSTDYLVETNGLIIFGYDANIGFSLNDSIAFVSEKQSFNTLNISKIISLNKYQNNLKKSIRNSNLLIFFICLIIQIALTIAMIALDNGIVFFKIRKGYEITNLVLNYPIFYAIISLLYILAFELFNYCFVYFKLGCFPLNFSSFIHFASFIVILSIGLFVLKKQFRRA